MDAKRFFVIIGLSVIIIITPIITIYSIVYINSLNDNERKTVKIIYSRKISSFDPLGKDNYDVAAENVVTQVAETLLVYIYLIRIIQ